MWILGIAGSHNGAAALIRDGQVQVAIQAERLLRKKRHPLQLEHMSPDMAIVIKYCLDFAGIDLPDLHAIAICTPVEAVSSKAALKMPGARLSPRIISVPHHLAHAEYALHYSPMQPALVLVCDGSGTLEEQRADIDVRETEKRPTRFLRGFGKESISAYEFDGRDMDLVYRVAYGRVQDNTTMVVKSATRKWDWLESLGEIWAWAAEYCHGNATEAGKVMGLAPFGDPAEHARLATLGLDADGRVHIGFEQLLETFRTPNIAGCDVTGRRHYENLAAHVQERTNHFLRDLVRFLQRRHPSDRLCYSGGVALNSVANEYLREQLQIELHMNGSCEDNGTAIGAALAAYHKLTGRRVPEAVTDFYGRDYAPSEIAAALGRFAGTAEELGRDDLLRSTAAAIASGKVVGWFQGRSEFGPRALGNRSILADPRDRRMKDHLNLTVKHREAFRPYAPVVVAEEARKYFSFEGTSPVMLRVVPTAVDFLPAITHVDGTARVQTVTRGENALLYDLLRCFGAETGVPVLLNTSFNMSGQPIVETPDDALRAFVDSRIDRLVMGNFMVSR